jgi:transglutaminase-like putative cysteine protease
MSAATLRPRGSSVALPRAGNTAAVVLATLATVGATAWAVMSAAWVDGTAAVLLTATAGVLEATLVARSSVGRLIALLLLPVVGTLVVVPLTLGSMPGADSTTLGDAARQYVDALTTGLFVQGDWPFLVGLCGVFWLIGAWTGWLAVRERRGVLAVLPCYAVLAVNALNAPSLEHVAVPEAVAVALSLVVVGRVHLLELSARWRRSGVVALPGTERRFGRVTLGAALLLLVAAVVVPPVSTRDLSGVFFRFNGSGGHHGSGIGGGGSGPGTGPGTVRFDPATVPGGPLLSLPVNVLSYTTSSDQPFYLRVVDDAFFTQGNWFPNGPGSNGDVLYAPTFVTNPGGQIPRDRNPDDGGVAVSSSLQQVSSRVVLSGPATGDGGQLGIFPGEPDAVNVEGDAMGLAGGGLETLLTVDQYRVRVPTGSFVASGTVSTATAEQLRNAGTDFPAFVRQSYLDLNPSTSSDRAQVAVLQQIDKQWTVGQSNEYDQAAAIERHLRDISAFTYTLKPPKTRSGVWPIIDFLQRTHQGYCQYFASAMGALLRADGIPTRLVSGYGPGSVDDSRSRPGATLHTVSTSDAHVWVEAYFPRYGWIPFEPTPDGTYQPISRGTDNSTLNPSPTPVPSGAATPTPRPTSTPRSDVGGATGGSTGATLPPGLLGGVLSAMFLVAVAMLLRNWIAHPRTLPAMWRRLGFFGAAIGVRRRPSETYAAYVHRLSRALPPDTTTLLHRDGSGEIGPRPVRTRVVSALEHLASSAGKAEFSREGLDERERVQWRRSWDRVRRAAPLLLWRTFLARSARRGETF